MPMPMPMPLHVRSRYDYRIYALPQVSLTKMTDGPSGCHDPLRPPHYNSVSPCLETPEAKSITSLHPNVTERTLGERLPTNHISNPYSLP
jgi:hypothetical protein